MKMPGFYGFLLALLTTVAVGLGFAQPAQAQANLGCLSVGRAITPDTFAPVQEMTVTVTFDSTCTEDVAALGLVETLPPGWRYFGATGPNLPDVLPEAQAAGAIEFIWLSVLEYPASFSYTIRAPLGAAGQYSLSGVAEYRVGGGGRAQFTPPFVSTLTDGSILCLDEPACVSLTRSVPEVYPTGAALPVTITLAELCSEEITDLRVFETLPEGWTFASSTGADAPAVQPEPGEAGTLEFSWLEPPSLPVTFTYWVAVPGDSTGAKTLSGRVAWTTCDDEYTGAPMDSPLAQGSPAFASCSSACAGETEDADSDGLSDCVEECMGLDPEHPDTDRDGIPDAFEAAGGLNPADVNDAALDSDGDRDTNLREYLNGSDWFDADSPELSFYVATTGADSPGRGSADAPWRTIPYAVSQLADKGLGDSRIVLDSGVYRGDFALLPGMTLVGPPCIPGNIAACAGIAAHIEGADGALVRDAILAPANEESEETVLTMDNVATSLERVFVIGNAQFRNVGVHCIGQRPGLATIRECEFVQLDIGLEVEGCQPALTNNVFTSAATAYVVLRDARADICGGSFGIQGDGNSGWNRFVASEGLSVINERPATLVMERNDWDTNDDALIEARLQGPIDYDPEIEAFSNAFASSIFCTVLKAGTQEPITNASISLSTATIKPVTNNINGVYPFEVVPEGSYTINVQAPGFQGMTMPVFAARGEIVSAFFPLAAGAPVDPEEPRCGCSEPGKALPLAVDPGAAIVSIVTLIAMAAASLFGPRSH
jgi:hypothetical protein